MTQLINEFSLTALRPRAGRYLLNATGKPGTKVWVGSSGALPTLAVATSVALEALVGEGIALFIDPALRDEGLCDVLYDEQGALIAPLHRADVALLKAGNVAALRELVGRRVTVIMEVPSFSGGLTLRLRGKEMPEARAIAPQLPVGLLQYLRERATSEMDSLDFILTCGDALISLPGRITVQVC